MILASAPDGIGIVSGEDMQLAASNNLNINAGSHMDISVVKKLSVGDAVTVFAKESGMKLFAGKGKVEVQVQNDGMQLAAKPEMEISSVEGKVIISAKNELLLNCGGGYTTIETLVQTTKLIATDASPVF